MQTPLKANVLVEKVDPVLSSVLLEDGIVCQIAESERKLFAIGVTV
jgi:hypothetical protein